MRSKFEIALIFVLTLVDVFLFVQVGMASEDRNVHTQNKLFIQNQGGENIRLRTYISEGVVKKVDPDNGIVTMFMNPVPDLKWQSMIRIFSVTDKSVFEHIKVGDKLKFEFERDESKEMMINLK